MSGGSMKNFVDRMYIFVGMGLFSWGELMCSAPRVAQKEIQKAAYPAKKEIFIAGPPKEHFEGMSPDALTPSEENNVCEVETGSSESPKTVTPQSHDREVKSQCEQKINYEASISQNVGSLLRMAYACKFYSYNGFVNLYIPSCDISNMTPENLRALLDKHKKVCIN